MAIQNLEHFGIRQDRFEELIRIVYSVPAVERAILFGSRAKSTHRPGSDIDLALDAPGISRREFSKIYWDLDDSNLAQKIDLLLLSEVGDKALIDSIKKYGQILPRPAAAGGKSSGLAMDLELGEGQ